MQKTDLLPAETLGASQEGTLVIEQFLMANYRFRRNILNGKVEFAILPKAGNKAEGNTVGTSDSLSCASDEADLDYRPLTPAALNSIIIRAKREQVMEKKDLAEIFMACFRQPREGEVVKTMNCDQMMSIMQKDYPTLQNTIGNRVRLGKTISAMGFEHKEHSHVAYYKVVLLRAA